MSDRNRTGISDQFNITQQPQPADSGESSTSNQQWCARQQPRPLERGGESSTSNQQMHGWQQPQPLEGSGGTSTSNQQRHARQQPRPLERGGESSTSNQQMHALQQPQPLERGGNSSSNQQIYTQLTTGTKRTEYPNEVTDTRQPPQHRQRSSMHGSGSGTNSESFCCLLLVSHSKFGCLHSSSKNCIYLFFLVIEVLMLLIVLTGRYVVDNENIADQQGTEETRRPVFQGHENDNCDCQLNESIDNTAAHESHPEASHIFQQAPNQPTYHQAGIQSNVRPLQYYPSPLVIQYLIQLQNLSLIFRTNFTSTSLQPAHHANEHPNPGTVNNITSTSRQPGPHDFQGHQDEYHVRQEINPLPGSNFESSSRDPSSHSSQGPQNICIYCHQGISIPHIALTHEGRYCGHLCHPRCFNYLPVEVQQSNETCPECWRRPPHLNTH